MSVVLSMALAASLQTSAHCSWDRPNQRPFTGDVVAAVDHYRDLPPDVRQRLKARLQRHDYDDLVEIRRDRIEGLRHYEPEIRGMHFGANAMCRTVSRRGWANDHVERGLVYCDTGHCLMVPTVCRNVSRVVPRPSEAPPLVFEPPGAGPVVPPADAGPPEPDVPVAAPPPADGPPLVFTGPPAASPPAVPRLLPPAWVPPPLVTVPGPGPGGGWPPAVVPPAMVPPEVPPIPPQLPPPVPEPASFVLMCAGWALLTAWARRRPQPPADRCR